MDASLRKAVVCSAKLRNKCRFLELDEALQASLRAHNVQAVTAWQLARLRRDVEQAIEGKRSDEPTQITLAM